MAKLLVLHGPNLNLLGKREPEHYGSVRLSDLDARLQMLAREAGHELTAFQSNAEHELVARIHQAGEESVAFIIINPAAFTHTSVSLRDALLGVAIPFIEVHLSNVYRREEFRHHSFLSDIAAGIIAGLGPKGYELAVGAVVERLQGAD